MEKEKIVNASLRITGPLRAYQLWTTQDEIGRLTTHDIYSYLKIKDLGI